MTDQREKVTVSSEWSLKSFTSLQGRVIIAWTDEFIRLSAFGIQSVGAVTGGGERQGGIGFPCLQDGHKLDRMHDQRRVKLTFKILDIRCQSRYQFIRWHLQQTSHWNESSVEKNQVRTYIFLMAKTPYFWAIVDKFYIWGTVGIKENWTATLIIKVNESNRLELSKHYWVGWAPVLNHNRFFFFFPPRPHRWPWIVLPVPG